MSPPQTQQVGFITLLLLHRRAKMFLAENVFHTKKNQDPGCSAGGITQRQMSKQKANSRLVLNIANETPAWKESTWVCECMNM